MKNINTEEMKGVRRFQINYFVITTMVLAIIIRILSDSLSSFSFISGSFISLVNLLTSGFILEKAIGNNYGIGIVHIMGLMRISVVVLCAFLFSQKSHVYLLLFMAGYMVMIFSFLAYAIKRRD